MIKQGGKHFSVAYKDGKYNMLVIQICVYWFLIFNLNYNYAKKNIEIALRIALVPMAQQFNCTSVAKIQI